MFFERLIIEKAEFNYSIPFILSFKREFSICSFLFPFSGKPFE